MFEEINPADGMPVVRYGKEEADRQLCFQHVTLKACYIGEEDGLMGMMPALFLEFSMIRADGSDESPVYEVYVSPEDLADLGGMCAKGLGKLLQDVCDERTRTATAMEQLVKEFRDDQG